MLTLTDDWLLALDPVRFAIAAGVTPDPWQGKLLRSSAPRIAMNVTRQGGKSSVAALLALHTSIYEPGSLSLILSPSQRQSGELFLKLKAHYHTLGRPVVAEAETALTLTLENGSRVVALPGTDNTVRGFSGVDLLIIDESSRVDDSLYFAVRPMLAVSHGRLVTLSTPYGTRGWWWESWRGSEAWERYEIPAEQCPRITPEFLADERRAIGSWWFEQEYHCNPPEAPIWMGDFSFQPIGDVKVGDTVIGWYRPVGDTTYAKVHMTRAEVLAVGKREADIIEVHLESGRVIYCTPDHKWLTMSAGNSQDYYVPATPGKRLVYVIEPTKPLPEHLQWDAAWLGGMYDGEGNGDTIAQSAEHNPQTRARILNVLKSLGLGGVPSGEHQIYLRPGDPDGDKKQALVNFLNWTRPTKRDNGISRHILRAHFRHEDRVVEVRPAGRSTVVSMQTTTGNYIVWGYASKNCQFQDAQTSLFHSDDIDRMFSKEIEIWPL